MDIVIRDIQFKGVTEEFALKLAQALLKQKVPSISKVPEVEVEVMTEDLTPEELNLLDDLADQINADTLKTEPEPTSLPQVIREVMVRFVEEGVTLLETKEFVSMVQSVYQNCGGQVHSPRKLSDSCRDVAKRMGARSIQKGIWKLPTIVELS